MAEIDLIPAEYRDRLARRAQARLGIAVIAGVIATGILTSGVFQFMTRAVQAERQQLQLDRAMSEQRSAEFARLNEIRDKLKSQYTTLIALRGGAAASRILLTIDRALPESGIWFSDWEFLRAGLVRDDGDGDFAATGYFVVKPAGVDINEDKLRIQTHMKIRGQAADHAALSRFVRNLFAQPEILDVRLLRTAVRRYVSTSLVDFDLSIVLRSEVQPG